MTKKKQKKFEYIETFLELSLRYRSLDTEVMNWEYL